PVILVPLAAINNLSTQQLEAVLLHELSHIRRYDYLFNLIINFIQSVLYFNPFVKALVKTVEREREKSCDEMVIQFEYDPHGYASALLILERKNEFTKPLAVAASGKKNDLLHRVELILGIRKKPVLSFNKLAGLFVGLLCIIGLNAVLIFSKPENENRPMTMTNLITPFYFFDTQKGTAVASNSATEAPKKTFTTPIASNSVAKTTPKPKKSPVHESSPLFLRNDDPGFVNVSFDPVVVPQLKGYQEEQVRSAVDASKKVLENAEWKKVEKSVADVFTLNEKVQLRKAYLKEINRIDWNKWEDKLRIAYNKVDWDKLNEQLGRAVNRITLDSLQKVYTEVSNNLGSIEQQLNENNLSGIPDTDISISEVQKKQLEVLRVLNNLKAVRIKKIVHL
ncbi:MAG TPA: M56 family metallopeptidase, partial [Chitinophagaceae bacterium]|nr:M56 family metallopeptidase [Chitinophagaceae bacterium]